MIKFVASNLMNFVAPKLELSMSFCLTNWPQALLTHIRLGWTGLLARNSVTYLAHSKVKNKNVLKYCPLREHEFYLN